MSHFRSLDAEERFIKAVESIASSLTTPQVLIHTEEEPWEEPTIEELASRMIRGERVLFHNRVRLAEYALSQSKIKRPPVGAWATTVQEVLTLINPDAPKGSILIERIVTLFDDMQSHR